MNLQDKIQTLQDKFNISCGQDHGLELPHGSSFEGIPQNLGINVSSWVALVVLFFVLRKIAWNYGRIALVNRKEESKGGNHSERWTELFYGDMQTKEQRDRTGSIISIDSVEQNAASAASGPAEKGLSWFSVMFRWNDDHIARRCGLDAVQFLQFQRYLIVYMAVVTLLSLAVILPVNISGRTEESMSDYAFSTISNLNANSPKLWVHTIMSLAFLLIAVVFMRKFSAKLDVENEDDSARTLMVNYVPKDHCFKNVITQHFKEAYPEAIVEDVQFSFNIQNLADLDELRRCAHEGSTSSEQIANTTGVRPMMVPYYFGRLCCCCTVCGCRQVDAIDYYTAEEQRLEKEIEKEKINAFQECTGIAFVIFQNEHMAHKIYYDHNQVVCSKTKPQTSSLSRELGANNWDVEFAPDPNDINWQNLSLTPFLWWMRAIAINIVLLITLFFLTTPSVILNHKGHDPNSSDLKNAFQAQFLPSLILWFFSIMLPYLVFYSDQFVGHWTRTKEHQTVMRKTYVFLLLMIVILPSLGLPSAKAFFQYTFGKHKLEKQLRWGCIFLPGNGAFFVNYVITSAFIGNALTLIRFPELCMYTFRMLAARSAYEQSAVRRAVIWEFQFGQEYAWMLCIFTVAMAYSVLSPLVTPFGLVYLIGKYFMDRYNLYYAYKPSKINHHIHTSAINFVIIALIILQFNMLFYNTIRTSWRHGLPVFSAVVVFFSLLFLTGRLFFGWFKSWAPIKYRQFENRPESEETTKMTESRHSEKDQWNSFMPRVLQEARADSSKHRSNTQSASNGSVDYGTIDPDGNTQVLDSTTFADPEYIDTNMRRTESSPSVTESESSEDGGDNSDQQSGDNQSTDSDDRITPFPHQVGRQEGDYLDEGRQLHQDDSHHVPQPARRTAPRPYNQRE